MAAPAKKPKKDWEPCLHCKCRPGKRSRGLCKRCFNDPEVRAKYGPRSPRGRRMPALSRRAARGDPPLPRKATEHLPGTAAKIKVLMERLANGYALWHPQDARPGRH